MPCSIINATIAAIVCRIVLFLPMQNGVWKSSPYVRISAAEVSEYGHDFLIKRVGWFLSQEFLKNEHGTFLSPFHQVSFPPSEPYNIIKEKLWLLFPN